MNCKKLMSLLATCALAAGLAATPASAANITMSGTASEYSAYRLLDLEQGLKPGHTDGDACDVTDPAGTAAAEHFAYKYTVNAAYKTAIAAGVAAANPSGVTVNEADYVDFISGLSPDGVRAFANAVFGAITGPADATADRTFTGLPDGYYLIAETATAGDGDSVSLVMLDTAGKPDITVTSKEDVPILEKKVIDADGHRIGDSDTVAVGDEVFYEITVTAPKADIMAQYDTYKYVIHDDIGDGLRFNSVTACFKGGNISDAVTGYTTAVKGTDTMADETCDVEFTFADVKPLFDGVAGDRTLTVRYKCVVTESAVAGKPGNSNTAHLEFSNNPYATDETTESTTSDKVTVFTFELNIDKTDKDGRPLSGAEFTLFKGTKTGDDITWATTGTVVPAVGGDATKFALSGLDEGFYKLEETGVPDGYQKAADVMFEIRAEHDAKSDDPQLTGLGVYDMAGNSITGDDNAFKVVLDSGSVATAVVNVTGNRLPTTGGAGTYLLYAGGVVLVLGGGALLVLKKKKSGDEA